MAKRLKDPDERFRVRVSTMEPTACWLWTGSAVPAGYGMFWPYGRAGGKVYAHRWSYERFVGSISEGLTIDHLCRVKACVNPHHLEVVTYEVNARRGRGWKQDDSGVWRCARGHLVDESLRVTKPSKRGSQTLCVHCQRERRRRGQVERFHLREASNDYNAKWQREQTLHRLVAEHPGLATEVRAVGAIACRMRLRYGWTYDDEKWIAADGRLIYFVED